ncbi:hypothetical protein FCI23_06845 [Actinacidiphila oryziradicis]|uniref:Uncharacterized protein n=1 Tax=Actinacidiphila oryziradicis TaxID=2571141 RepID=A0A4U0SSX4_9ACTN|nr:hypothetical protein FCI23_06845 [Actinacidiphila oryziradicis]
MRLLILGILLRALIAPLVLIGIVVLSFAAALGVSTLVFNRVPPPMTRRTRSPAPMCSSRRRHRHTGWHGPADQSEHPVRRLRPAR